MRVELGVGRICMFLLIKLWMYQSIGQGKKERKRARRGTIRPVNSSRELQWKGFKRKKRKGNDYSTFRIMGNKGWRKQPMRRFPICLFYFHQRISFFSFWVFSAVCLFSFNVVNIMIMLLSHAFYAGLVRERRRAELISSQQEEKHSQSTSFDNFSLFNLPLFTFSHIFLHLPILLSFIDLSW